MAGIEHGPRHAGPAVDPALRTSRPGVFAAGNVLHGAEPADVAALGGRHAAAAAARYLADSAEWPQARIRVVCRPPLHWISPNVLSPGVKSPPRGHFTLRARAVLSRPRIEVSQDGRVIWTGRPRRLVPGRSSRVPVGWVERVDPAGGPVEVGVRGAQRLAGA